MGIDPEAVRITEMTPDHGEVELTFVETWDGLYAPVGLRTPDGPGPFPLILLASGNGGEGMAWIRDAMRNRGWTMDRLVEAGYACAWIRYRTEVELGYNNGGPLVRDARQGREMFNRSPLEYEDEIAIIEYFNADPRFSGVGLIGMSHGGEMVMKICSEYHGAVVGVASEPASHEYLALNPDHTAPMNEETHMRNIEDMQMAEVEKVRSRIDMDIARARVAGIQTPILVMGRETDHLQGIFRTTYDMLAEAGKDCEWVSWDHDLHGYVYPMRGADGEYEVNDVQRQAVAGVIAYLDRYMK
jgi:hypothetical protein